MSKSKILRLISASGATGLGILMFILLACPNLESASAIPAADVSDVEDMVMATADTGALTQVWVRPSLSIALDPTINIDSAGQNGNFLKGMVNLRVATNSTRGFKVLVNTTTESTNLIATDNTSNVIPTIAENSTPGNFPESGGWGYVVDSEIPNENTSYRPASTIAAVAKETTTSAATTNYKFGVGVKIDPTTAVGNYQSNLLVSVVANPIAAFNLSSITRMQDMTPDICKNTQDYVSTSNYQRKQLKDDRDGKLYWVAKLADGNCWMVENLAYSLGEEMTSADTDLAPGAKKTISSGWWHPNSYWYYDWNTAVAKSGDGLGANQEAPDSICPKGWQLPVVGSSYNTITKSGNPDKQIGSGSFYDLFMSYGITNYSTMTSIGTTSPLNFVATGAILNPSSGTADNVGQGGWHWSRVSANSTSANYSWWGTIGGSGNYNFTPTYTNYRTYGGPVRCLARRVTR